MSKLQEIEVSVYRKGNPNRIALCPHAFPFPFAHMGLEPHPTKKERWVLKNWHDFYLNRRHLPLARWDILRRHFAALVKMAEHAPS